MEKLKRIVVLDGDPIATFISQEVFAHVEPALTVVYLTGISDALAYLKQTFPKNTDTPAGGLQLLLVGQTLNSLAFLKQLNACQHTNRDNFYIVVLIRSSTLEEIKSISKYKVDAYYSEIFSTDLVVKIISDCNSSQSSRTRAI